MYQELFELLHPGNGANPVSFVLQVDDLVEPGPEQIAFPRRLVLLRSHRVLRCGNRIMASQAKGIPKRNCKVLALRTAKPCNPKPAAAPKTDSSSNA